MMRHHLHMPSYFLGTFTEYPYFIIGYFYFCFDLLISSCTMASKTATVVKFTISLEELSISVKCIGLFNPI